MHLVYQLTEPKFVRADLNIYMFFERERGGVCIKTCDHELVSHSHDVTVKYVDNNNDSTSLDDKCV